MCNFYKGGKFSEMKILVTIFCFEMVFCLPGVTLCLALYTTVAAPNPVQPLLIVMLIVLCAQ